MATREVLTQIVIALALVISFQSAFVAIAGALSAERSWPGAVPDCWTEERNFHSGESNDSWQANTLFKKISGAPLKPGVYSPNKGYYFVAEDGRPNGAVTIFVEKNYLIRIEFTQLFGLADVKWVNEKLLFMRPWWGRIAATDLIYDVEAEKVVYSENLTDGYLAYQQFRESCPLVGCECIKKKLE
jgi:hypothetical protein